MVNIQLLKDLIAEASSSAGSERGNYQLFVTRLCDSLGLPQPSMQDERGTNDYVFERKVAFHHPDGTSTPGFIDCYKRGCFVLEAKQSSKSYRTAASETPALFNDLAPARKRKGGWDQLMIAARKQAEDYARALPVDHGYPPFLIVLDIGHVIELYADFSGQGKNYAHFPDRQSFRIHMEDLLDEKVQERLIGIWNNPESLDPARKSAEVTSDIAARLAKIAAMLEKKHAPGTVAQFLMRCLFTMFAEDVGLLPDHGFEKLLAEQKATPKNFVPALENLWATMDKGGYSPALNAQLKYFNGTLFKSAKALVLEADAIHELHVAAKKDWSQVEPAIFGTLLERALDPAERAKLGAHYTPRAYVERLVIPTIIEPLRKDWELVRARAEGLRAEGKNEDALKAIKDYHHKLCTTRVLDPACGTGNFLYVSLELMKRLEGEVLEAAEEFGENNPRLMMEGETVNPRQFYGLEINPRAVPIADLVLWIGFLKWQIKTISLDSLAEPLLHAYGTIKQQDAVISYSKAEMLRGPDGKPLSRWDGVTKKLHPITGEEIPDPDATREMFKYHDPRIAPWPEVEFIVGNPPFIGGKDMRQELGDGYAEACWQARPHVPGGADFVMHFWDEAARILLAKGSKLRRFGFITTNSITQTFSRKVMERHLKSKEPLSLIFAVPDHPWLKAMDKAAVRIAMTVAEKGEKPGMLMEEIAEADLNTDTPRVELRKREGKISSKLSLGANLSILSILKANALVALKGFELGTQALLVKLPAVERLRRIEPNAEKYIFPYVNGNDLKNGRIWRHVIDTFPVSWAELSKVPVLQNYLLESVWPTRNPNGDAHVLARWWQFRRSGQAIREAIAGTDRFIATTRTAKHRFFTFLDSRIRAESKTVIIAAQQAALLAVLSSRTHVHFANAAGGWQGAGNDPVYQHTETFDPFPFPAEFDHLRALGERLDAFRKERLAAHEFLTMTALYNALERQREIRNGCDVPPLTAAERDVHEAGLISVLAEIHDEIDRETLKAYGWADLIPALVGKPGGTVPTNHKSAEQEAAEEALLTRLVALNQQRAEEEKRGLVRWLRPEYQIPRLGQKVTTDQQIEADLEIASITHKPKWPTDELDQIRIICELLANAHAPLPRDAIFASLDGRITPQRKQRVERVLETLVAIGSARRDEGRYFVPRN